VVIKRPRETRRLPKSLRARGARLPEFKPARLATRREIELIEVYPYAVSYAIGTYYDGLFHAGYPRDYYTLDDRGDSYLLVNKSFDLSRWS